MIKRTRLFLFLLLLILLTCCALGIYYGSVSIHFQDFFDIIFHNELSKTGYILKYIRFPRVLASVMAGIGLATAGVIIQTIFHNPLAGPSIIGVNSGAGFFVVLISAVFPNLYGFLPFASFLGAFLTVLTVYFLGMRSSSSKYSILLAGMAINSLLSSATETIYLLNDDYIINNKLFRIGSLSNVNIKILPIASAIILLGLIITLLLGNQLELMSLGDEAAITLGLSVGKYRLIFLLLAAVLSGTAISFVGMIGFVGLIIPHIARIFVGDNCHSLLATSAILGAILVTFCDLLGRLILAPFEIPVGILLSFLGVPFFLILLYSQRSKHRYD